jgi:hypothetical protein
MMNDDERRDHLSGAVAQEELEEEQCAELAEAAGWELDLTNGVWRHPDTPLLFDSAYEVCCYDNLFEVR